MYKNIKKHGNILSRLKESNVERYKLKHLPNKRNEIKAKPNRKKGCSDKDI